MDRVFREEHIGKGKIAMKMKKILAVMLAASALMTAGLTACGDDSSSSGNDSAASQSAKESSKSAAEVADALKDGVEFKDSLNEPDKGMIEKLYGLSEDMYKEGKLYIGSGGATAEEIACFTANDADGAAKIKEAYEKRIEDLKKTFENYVPEEMDKLNDPVIVTKGNSVYMCLSNDNDKAKEIIG